MVENRPFTTLLAHVVLILGVVVVAFPLYVTFVASTLTYDQIITVPMPLTPGDQFFENYGQVLRSGSAKGSHAAVLPMLANSLAMAVGVAVGKIAISIVSAFAIVYFRFPLRRFFFWMIFVTLMLPIEVRIIPTYGVAASLHLLNSYSGLILPLIASATATFLFRQFYLTVPDELAEAARMDGAGPLRF
ncbi:MAG TPA: ABC transporter permease subunit, partial [Usitatibacter sp.]|nr:ABC transporter permease subunit [Usitatibacter sp.]